MLLTLRRPRHIHHDIYLAFFEHLREVAEAVIYVLYPPARAVCDLLQVFISVSLA